LIPIHRSLQTSLPQAETLRIPGSPFNALEILLLIRLVIEGALSLRATTRAGCIIDQHDGGTGLDGPCQTTIQNYLMRIGLYLISRVDQVRSDWVWLLDHTVAAGSTKCLIVMAISLEQFRRLGRPPVHQDFTVIGLFPVETSNGEVVAGQLQSLAEQFGTPVATLSDRGSDLKKGVENFRERQPQTLALYDIVHLVCRFIKAILEADPRFDLFRKACCRCANFLRQSPLAHLKPPTPKTKARYMNFDREIRWGMRALAILDRVVGGALNDRQCHRLPKLPVEERLGWLREFRESISTWMEVIWTGKAITELIRREGYHRETASRIQAIGDSVQYAPSRTLIDRVSVEVHQMCRGLDEGGSYPGSTEVLESLIGRGKRLLHSGGHCGLTGYILSMATATTELTTDLVRRALTACRIKHVQKWVKKHFPEPVHTKRKNDLVPTQEEQNLRKLVADPTPNS